MTDQPWYSTLPDGRRVQRMDTLGVPLETLVGREVHHPHMQVGESECAWTKEEVLDLERVLFTSPATELEDWYPESHDIGILVEVFQDKDFPDRTRGRFKDAERVEDLSHRGLHYDVTNLWVVVEDA